MGIEAASFVPAVLFLAGFFGILTARSSRARSLSWCLLQAGPLVFLLSFAGPSPLGKVLGLLAAGIGCLTALVLFSLGGVQADPAQGRKRKGR